MPACTPNYEVMIRNFEAMVEAQRVCHDPEDPERYTRRLEEMRDDLVNTLKRQDNEIARLRALLKDKHPVSPTLNEPTNYALVNRYHTTVVNVLASKDEESKDRLTEEYAEAHAELVGVLDRLTEENKELHQKNVHIQLHWAGALGTLDRLSGHYRLADALEREDAIEELSAAAEAWCESSGWSYRIIGHKLSLEPPKQEQHND